ncbi:hypothetical protein JTE90_009007 [Oedothorax gibbosus]|uniref:RNA-directed DNA polymerase n=1 Tax=Oedothorax gibbosus TaxID=931172 RepID=A0AAV6VL73_9ARAC|nr:hypothetical protein JTE90_009007 [Oedothorax gibbosus]
MPIFRDTGTSIDVVCRNRITPEMLTGENIWVQQPLDEFPICLPFSEVELKGEFGHVITKAAVVPCQLDKGRYLLGNQTAALLETMKNEDVPHQINAIETRAKKRKAEQEQAVGDIIEEVVDEEENENDEITIDEDDLFSFPPKEDNYEGLALLKVDSKTFLDQQKECPELKSLLEKVQENTGEPVGGLVKLENGILVKRKMDKTGVERPLLVVPKKYRNDLKAFCHEGTSGQLRVTKTKDIFSRHFFWPQCYKEIEDYVRSCDRCQRVGKPFDKKKAPMKIVPVIQEVFSKINVDACGPLPVTPSGKRYLLTAMCLSSKYPDAVPVEDITSVTVVDVLLAIFSRMGFPKVLQLDQGSSFTSALSTTFLEKFGHNSSGFV